MTHAHCFPCATVFRFKSRNIAKLTKTAVHHNMIVCILFWFPNFAPSGLVTGRDIRYLPRWCPMLHFVHLLPSTEQNVKYHKIASTLFWFPKLATIGFL